MSTALPDIQSHLHMSVSQLQWILNAFFLGVSSFMASMGRVADLYGRRKVFYSGTLVFGLASIGAGLATTPGVLIACRVFQGIATAITIPVGIALIQVAHDKHEIAKAMSVFGSITGLGLALGPVLGGVLVTAFGWPSVFFVNIPFVVIGFLLCMVSVKESRSHSDMTLDYFGIIFLMLTTAALVFAMVEANSAGWGSELVIASFVVSIICFIIFVFVERNVKHSIMAGYLFRHRIFVSSILFVCVGGSAMGVVLFIDPLYLHVILGKNNFITGVILFIIPLSVVFCAYMIGHIHRSVGSRFLMIIGSLAYLFMSGLHMILGISVAWVIIVPTFLLMGLGWGIMNTVPGIALGESMHGDQIGVAIGALYSFFNISAAVILALSVVVFHMRTSAALMTGFSRDHVNLSVVDKGYLEKFMHQPDQLYHMATKFNMNHAVAIDLLKNAFVSGMHVMYVPVAFLAFISLLGLVFFMKT